MFGYIVKRLIQMVPLLFIISFVAFGIIRVAEVFANADPLAQMKMSPSITDETLRRERQRMGFETNHKEKLTLKEAAYPITSKGSKEIPDDSVAVSYPKSDEAGQVAAGEFFEFVRPRFSTVDGKSVKQDPQDVKLQPGQFTFSDKTFYFHKDDMGKEILVEFGTPNTFVARYFVWLKNFLNGNLGESYAYKAPVSTLIVSRLGNTALLGMCTLVFTWMVAIQEIPWGFSWLYASIH